MMDVKEIRELAKRFSPEQIKGCITKQLDTEANICLQNADTEKIINELAKAQFIRSLTDKGIRLPDALRELSKRVRIIQRKSNNY